MSTVTYDEFRRMDIRVVRVTNAEPVPGRSKIVRLELEIGQDKKRTIIAGGAQYYKPEDFIGKKFIAIVNLEPRNLAGVTSEGMLLATSTEKPLWLAVDASAPVGSRII